MTKEKTINGVKFAAAPLTAIEGLKLKAFLVRSFGPALGEALGSFGNLLKDEKVNADMAIDGQGVARAIERMMMNLDPDQFIELLKKLFSNVTAQVKGPDGKDVLVGFIGAAFDASMELAFAQRTFSVYPVILLVLEVNFPDFFEKAGAAIGTKMKAIVASGKESSSGKSA
jgi:hypothetical protein